MLTYHVKNFLDDNLRNDSSTRAANAAFCAADAGRFQEFHDAGLPGPARPGGRRASPTPSSSASRRPPASAADAMTTWQGCVDDGRYDAYVDSVEQKSFTDGVRGTPTVRIDGKDQELGAIASPEGFTAAVEAASK